jgi:hypothetical protein
VLREVGAERQTLATLPERNIEKETNKLMDIDVFKRRPTGEAYPDAKSTKNVARVETTIEADDGQQFKIILVDADDSFDLVVHYPDSQREIVWSLARERKV